MNVRSRSFLSAVLMTVAAAGSIVDLHRVETETLVLYTTPALRDVLELFILPQFTASSNIHVVPLYLTAGQEYYRLRISSDRPEADLFLHASPLFLEKGFDAGLFQGHNVSEVPEELRSNRTDAHGRAWHAFAWSPLVEVFGPGLGEAPDLNRPDLRWGLPHPQLSGNGIYVALFFERMDAAVGAQVVGQAIVQPTNARTNIQGVADGSFDVTLGYEAVVKFFQGRGAKVEYDVPLLGGQRATTPILFCVSLVTAHPRPSAQAFIDFLFSPTVQGGLAKHHFRPVAPGAAAPEDALPLEGVEVLRYDWGQYAQFEQALLKYEVRE